MNVENFNNLFIADMEEISQKVAESLIMCGTKNWDFYFAKKPRNCDSQTLKNISLIEFNSLKEFETYKKHHTFLDFSIEHDIPMVLTHG